MAVMRNALLGLLLVFTGQASAAVEPGTLLALERMGSYLRSLKQFAVQASSRSRSSLSALAAR